MKKVFIVLAALCLLTTAVMGVVSVSAEEVLYGDVDGNGRINNRDLGALQKYLNGGGVAIDEVAADVDGSGRINNRDLGLLQKYLNGADVPLGPEKPEADDNIYNDTELDWT